jgi:hypothetical protein
MADIILSCMLFTILPDPCKNKGCGTCATCSVVNHTPQCSCPPGSVGDALVSCTKTPSRCTNDRTCPKGAKCSDGYCLSSCAKAEDCSCGQVCSSGTCRMQCSNDVSCPQVTLNFIYCILLNTTGSLKMSI